MRKVRIWVDLTEEQIAACEEEARRRGVSTERVVEQFVATLLREQERERREGTDHPIIPA